MKRTKTLIKELLMLEAELDERDPKEIVEAIDKMNLKSTPLLSVVYEGAFDNMGGYMV